MISPSRLDAELVWREKLEKCLLFWNKILAKLLVVPVTVQQESPDIAAISWHRYLSLRIILYINLKDYQMKLLTPVGQNNGVLPQKISGALNQLWACM